MQLVKDNAEVLIVVLTEIFELIDANGDGHIDESEGKSLGLAMGETEEEAAESWHDMMKDMDALGDCNGMVEMNGVSHRPVEWEAHLSCDLGSSVCVRGCRVGGFLHGTGRARPSQTGPDRNDQVPRRDQGMA